ncbi:Vitellinogen, open beta-sheet [Popillia japonica]|uniref:Vitellinogen, open beta-sheet n=1 Tax=Popillia japonica TaxID=7064 RepID=A0AAW1N1L6_POPJA
MAALPQVGLALLLVVTLAAGEEKCRTGCHGVTPNVFKFAEGTTYKYDLDGKVDLTLSSAEGQHSTTKLKATVLLTQQGQCNQVLRLQNVQVLNPESKKYTNIEDIEKPIVLNFHDGHVEDIICTQPSDSQNSLNIKISSARNHQIRKTPSISRGRLRLCSRLPRIITATTKTQGDTHVITKTRNLNKCAHRESLRQDFMTTTFDPNSEIKSNPFLQGEYRAELKLKNGIPQVITVDEDYLYVPFSNGDKGAKANVHTQLKYVGTAKDNAKVQCTVPRSILFEDPHPVSADKSCVGPILKSIKETANAITVNVKEDTASRFNYLRKLMRSATKKDLTAVYSQVRAGAGFTSKDVGIRVFLDALFRTRTGEAVEVAIEIYKSNGLSQIDSKIFFASLNFVEHVTEGALSAAANLISASPVPREGYLGIGSPVPREGYLGIGALARKYCRQHSCDNVKALNNLLSALQSKLVSRPTNRDSENNVLSVLKAVRNAGHVSNPLAGKVIEIAQDKQAPARLRVGALEAYLAAPCNDRYRDSAIAILKDVQLDAEIRVKAYLALAECPNGKVATAVKNLIDNEPSIQVGGFIVSHLATLRSSTNRDKLQAKAQLGGIKTTKRYPLDFRQYSFNGEYSTYSSLGFAESIEGNIIYSQSSFLPRSISANLTVEWFGNNINVLEVNARQENLDALLASYFGPNGEFTSERTEETIKSGSAKVAGVADKIGTKLRSYNKHKREVSKAQLENFSKQLTDKQNPLNKDLDLDLSIRLFGAELVFYSLYEDIKEYDVDHVVQSVVDAIDETETTFDNFDRSFTGNAMFLDSEVSYPTSTGFPIRLGVEGTASTHVKASSYLPDTDDFKFSLIPSISAEVKAQFIVDAAVFESGLTVVGNLYSSVGGAVEASYSLDSFDYKFLLPLDKQELLTVTHNILFETREPCGAVTKSPLKFIQGKDFSICLDQLKSYVGLTFCADLNQPDVGEASANVLPYPFNGNSKLSVTILKDDFGFIRVHEKTLPGNLLPGVQGAVELVDTKNAVKTTFKYDVQLSHPSITFELQSPEIKGVFDTRLEFTQNDMYGLVRLASNDLEYYAKVGLKKTLAPGKRIFTPIMEYKAGQPPAQPLPYHVTGQLIEVNTAEGSKFTFDNVKLVSPDREPIGVLGSVNVLRNEVLVDITLDEGQHRGNLKGKVLSDKSTVSVNAQFTNSHNPNVNFDLKYTLKFNDIVNMEHNLQFKFNDIVNMEHNLQFIYGSDLSNKNQVIKFLSGISYANKGDDSEFETKFLLIYPGFGLDDKFNLKLKKKYLDLGLQFGYDKIKVGTEIEVELDKKNNGEIKSKEVVGHKSKIHHKIAVNGYSIDVKGDVKYFVEQLRGDIGHDLVIKITSKPDIKVKTELKYTQHDIDTYAKITYGPDVIVDGFLKGSKVGNVNGNLKANIPGHLVANGNVKANKGKGSGSLLVNLQQFQRKIKTDVEFAVTEVHYKLDATLYTNFEKDNSKKYRLVTDNEYNPRTSLDSKNILEILDEKTVFNIKVSAKGDITNMEENLDTELILPNEQYYAAKFHRNHKKTGSVINGQSYLSLEQRSNKNAAGKTLTLKEVGKNVDINDRTFELTYSVGLDDGAGNTLNGELGLKKSRVDGEGHLDYSGKLYGSVLSETLQANIISKYKGTKADYKFSSSYGKGATLNIKGKHDIQTLESRQPSSLELAVDVLTPNSVIKVIKYNIQGSAVLPTVDHEDTDVKLSTSLFIDDDGKEQGATVDFKYDGACTHKKHQGSSTQSFTVQNQDPFVVTTDYKYDDTKFSGDVSLKYSKDKEVKLYGQLEVPNNETLKFDLQLETPIEKARKVRLDGFISESKVFFKSEAALTVDDLKYVEKVNIDIGSAQPLYDIELIYPTGKVDKLYAKLLRNDDNGFAFEEKEKIILHMYDFTLDTAGDVKFNNFEDFTIKLSADSPKLNINKISQANTQIIDGSTTYKYHKEEGKIIIDGSGTLTVNNEKKSGNFKVLYRDLDLKRDKEKGLQLTINSVVGNKAFDIEFIQTDTHFKYLTSYCIEKKDCAHVEVEAKKVSNDVDTVVVNVDLRPLGVSHEFGLKSDMNSKLLKHTLDVHLVSNEFKYQYNVLILPTKSHFTLTTPKRIVSLESEVIPSKNKGPTKGSIVLYTNKKLKPQDKTELQFQIDSARNYVNFNAKLTAPPLHKPLTVTSKYNEGKGDAYSYELVLDILPNSDKKIIVGGATSIEQKDDSITTTEKYLLDLQPINYKLTEESRSFVNYKTYETDLDYVLVETYRNKPIKTGYSFKFNKDSFQTELMLYNKVIFGMSSTAKFSKEYSVIDSQCTIIGCAPLSSRLELKNGNAVRYVLHKTASPQTKLELNSGLILGSIADFRVDLHKENKKIDLVHGSIKLDESDFGKSEYAVNTNDIQQHIISPMNDLSQNVAAASTDHFNSVVSEAKKELQAMSEAAQTNRPNFTPIMSYYEAEAKALREELITDQSLKQLTESLGNIVSAVITVTVDLVRTLADTTEKFIVAIHQQSINLVDLLANDIIPKVRELVVAIGKSAISVFESVNELMVGLLQQVTNFFDAHQNEVKQIATALSQLSKDIISFIQKINEELVLMARREISRITYELQSLPLVDEVGTIVKDTLTNKTYSDEALTVLLAQAEALKETVKLEKFNRFIDLLVSYAEKKLNKVQCDDSKEVSAIVTAGIQAAQEVFEAFIPLYVDDLDVTIFDIPIPSKLFKTLPDLIETQVSLVNRILNRDIPTLAQLYSWTTLNPEQFIPPFRKYAIIAQGQHIFTFDGKHLTFPGKCPYLLAKDVVNNEFSIDVVNNEFSIVGVYANGALSELTFVDKADTITLKKSGAATLNGATTEFPVRGSKTEAFRTYHEVHLKSTSGVNIYCQPDLSLCMFSVSGYYHGQLKGILGNANAEPFDDYTTAKGAITTSESDFGNSYKIGNCAAVKTVDHHTHQHAESCTKLFTEISELSLCYPFVNPSNFRQACDHGVAAGVANTEAAIAAAYVLACKSKYIPIFLPSKYVKCENCETPRELYDMYSVKLPQKAADIVFAIDVNEDNEAVYKELIQVLGISLIKDLGEKGIKDIEYHVLTFGGNHPEWPSHITSNGGKMTFKGKMPNLKFSKPVDEDDLDFGHETINFIISLVDNYLKQLALALGFDSQSHAYLEAIDYPFRTEAAKAIIAVSSAPCEKTESYILHLVQKLRAALVQQPTVHLNLITPLSSECSFKVKDDKTTKNVVGFNSHGVFTFADAKKKTVGNPDLLKDLSYDDFCSEYTVMAGGNVFVLDNFGKNKKQFAAITSNIIADSLVSTEQDLDCACMRDGLLTAKNVCMLIRSKEKPSSKKLLKG